MIRPATRAALIVAVVAVTLATLTGCSNDPAAAVGWLKGQPGIASAQVVESTNEELLVSGTTLGELKPGVSSADLAKLVHSVQAFTAKHHNVTIELGRNGFAFVVGSDSDTKTAIALWRRVSKVPKLLGAVTAGNAVNAQVLRPDVGRALDDLLGLGADLRLDAYPDLATANSSTAAAASISYQAKADCHPQRAVVAFAVKVAARDDVGSAQLGLCDGLSLTLTPSSSVAATAPTLRAELDAAGLSQFPVNLNNQPDDPTQTHSADVTPGDPTALGVLAGLEAAGTPPWRYLLTSDGTLTVTDFESPAATLLAAVGSAPGSAALPAIIVEGQDASVGGTLAQLPGLLAEATAVGASSPLLVQVKLDPTHGSCELSAPVGQDPDVVTAAAALKATGVTKNRTFTVKYIGYEVTIADGKATIGDPNYSGGAIMDQFVTAWNGG